MKTLILSALLVNSFAAFATEIRTYQKISANKAQVTITTEDTSGIQAIVYVDGEDNQTFVDMMLNDPTSELSQLVSKIELENCETNSTPEDRWIPTCGQVEVTGSVQTSFGRGGWMGGGAVYTLFVGFRSDGTGRFFEASHMVRISEGAEAQVNEEGDYSGVVIKTLELAGISTLTH